MYRMSEEAGKDAPLQYEIHDKHELFHTGLIHNVISKDNVPKLKDKYPIDNIQDITIYKPDATTIAKPPDGGRRKRRTKRRRRSRRRRTIKAK